MMSRCGLRLLLMLTMVCGASAQTPHTFEAGSSGFLFDGKPYQVISGEMHYPRVPRADWHDRFRKARAMGLNTITTYVFWNVHEPKPGVFDFTGQNDVAEYIREAQQEGLNVILRPGPYVCAEWELGGYPSWLLRDKSLVLRSRDPKYTAAVHAWFMRLGKEIRPLLLANGGPIIAVQLENEYGSFGDDKVYLEDLHQTLIASGMGSGLVYTADGPEQLPKGSLPALPAVINFGPGDAKKGFATLEKLRPTGPRMSGEYWAGWFDHWGESHHTTNAQQQADELRWMLSQGYSVSMYMFHGGTSFGWMNGANMSHTQYEPDTTSYDYDAPLDESGRPAAKYAAFRDVIADVTKAKLLPVPASDPIVTFPVAPKMLSASLWENLPKPVHAAAPLSMEDMDQSYGYVLYRTQLHAGQRGVLKLDGLHDYAQVYVNRELVGKADRRTKTDTVTVPVQAAEATLDILVENSGRVNFTTAIRGERKGLTGAVTLDGKAVEGWNIFPLPMDHLERVKFSDKACSGPCFYRTSMEVSFPADTYLDTRHLHKGMVWLGSTALGRFWSVGPQFALYTPGAWLRKGSNAITLFDLEGSATESLSTNNAPIFAVPSGAATQK